MSFLCHFTTARWPFSKTTMLGVKSDAHFQAALVLAERTFDKAWGQEEAKAAALAERQALELELQVAER